LLHRNQKIVDLQISLVDNIKTWPSLSYN
jgi:hypothetical protein